MENNKRPESMARINNTELANAFIDEQITAIRDQVGDKKVLLALSGGAEYAEDARERIFVQRVGGTVQRSGEGAVLAGVKVACRQGGFIALVAMLGADGGNDGERRNEQQRQREQQRRAQRAAAFPAFFFVPVYGVVKLGHGLIPRFLVFRARSVRRRLII